MNIKNSFFSMKIVNIFLNRFFAIKSVKYQYSFVFLSDLWSVNPYGSFELSHIEFRWFSFLTLQGRDFEKLKIKHKLSKNFDNLNFFSFFLKRDYFCLYFPNKGLIWSSASYRILYARRGASSLENSLS